MVHSTKELQPILKLGNKIYLRKNIKQVEVTDEMTGETRQEWQANETYFSLDEITKEITLAEVENNFNVYYNWATDKRVKKQLEKELQVETRKAIKEGKVAERLNDLEKATGTNKKKKTTGIASRLDDLENRIELLETP